MASQLVKFVKERDTKNTVRFQEQVEEGEPTLIGTIYVQKWWVKGANTLTINIKTED